jgi:1-aminocyclopropane-1-carboxylate deaminase/D-cysteine desulfhydrase-like pyridoxal-dependent ACC family enzyme
MIKLLILFLVLASSWVSESFYAGKELLMKMNIQVKTDDAWIQELNQRGIFTQSKDMAKIPNMTLKPALFNAYPTLEKNLGCVALGMFPTPVEKLSNLGMVYNHKQLYIKRDDLTGMRNEKEITFGGNKVRKLRFLLAEALAYGATGVITFGCTGSNHALATAVYARQLGLKALCMLVPQHNSSGVRNNLLMHQVQQSEIRYYVDREMRKTGTIINWVDYKQKYGTFPYIIPIGGSTALGTVGFVDAVFELKEQIQKGLLPEPDYIYVPCGSMGTTVGLLVGCKLAGLKTKIVAVTIEPETAQGNFKKGITHLFQETATLLHGLDASLPLVSFSEEMLLVKYDFCGADYALFTDQGMKARQLMYEKENIVLDGTYTAKACACLLHDLQNQTLANKVVLFWNTYCGLDFSKQLASVSYTKLPHCLRDYFEQPVQPLDMKL